MLSNRVKNSLEGNKVKETLQMISVVPVDALKEEEKKHKGIIFKLASRYHFKMCRLVMISLCLCLLNFCGGCSRLFASKKLASGRFMTRDSAFRVI